MSFIKIKKNIYFNFKSEKRRKNNNVHSKVNFTYTHIESRPHFFEDIYCDIEFNYAIYVL